MKKAYQDKFSENENAYNLLEILFTPGSSSESFEASWNVLNDTNEIIEVIKPFF